MSYNIVHLGDVKVLAKGQIVIPKEIRDKLGIESGDSLKIMLRNDGAIGIMKEKDLVQEIQKFQKMDFNKKEHIDEMKDIQKNVTKIMKHLKIKK